MNGTAPEALFPDGSRAEVENCATQGETMDELLANMREAIEGCLSVDVEAPFREGKERVLEIAISGRR